jgi:hypothetical protein
VSLFPTPHIITIWDKIKLFLTPMKKMESVDGTIHYKRDKNDCIYLYKIDPKKEV